MRRTFALLVAMALCGAAQAGEGYFAFYKKDADKYWDVFGDGDKERGQVTCYADTRSRDGSVVQIHRSLSDGEVWMFVKNTDWEIPAEAGISGTAHVNYYNANGRLIDGGDFEYLVKDKNTILILQIKGKKLADNLWNTKRMAFVMPGNLSNFAVGFEKPREVLRGISECVAQNETKYKGYKGESEKAPPEVKDKI